MPWREVCYMEERTRFIAAVLDEQESMTQLCEEYGISRKTGYKWLHRFVEDGPGGLAERSHAPREVPWAITQQQVQVIVGLRREHPSWGPKKLRARLVAREPERSWPALSTIGDLLRRGGLSRPRKRRPRATPSAGPLRTPGAPNQVWGIDFKGWFRTGDGARCEQRHGKAQVGEHFDGRASAGARADHGHVEHLRRTRDLQHPVSFGSILLRLASAIHFHLISQIKLVAVYCLQ